MKKYLLAIILFFLLISGPTAFAEEKFVFSGTGEMRDYNVEMTGPFLEPDGIQAGDQIVGYYAKHIFGMTSDSAAQYLFLGRTGEKTFQIESWNSLFNTKQVTNCYLDPDEPLILDRLIFIYLPNFRENRFKLQLISLKGNKLICQVIVPDEWKEYFQK